MVKSIIWNLSFNENDKNSGNFCRSYLENNRNIFTIDELFYKNFDEIKYKTI